MSDQLKRYREEIVGSSQPGYRCDMRDPPTAEGAHRRVAQGALAVFTRLPNDLALPDEQAVLEVLRTARQTGHPCRVRV